MFSHSFWEMRPWALWYSESEKFNFAITHLCDFCDGAKNWEWNFSILVRFSFFFFFISYFHYIRVCLGFSKLKGKYLHYESVYAQWDLMLNDVIINMWISHNNSFLFYELNVNNLSHWKIEKLKMLKSSKSIGRRRRRRQINKFQGFAQLKF